MKGYCKLILAMLIFGSIGLFARLVDLSSAQIVVSRTVIGSAFLALVLLLRGFRPDREALRKNAALLAVSGVAMGFNWLFLFEAYRYTTVSAATLAYYCAPLIVLLFSPLVLRERLTAGRLIGVGCAMAGMLLVNMGGGLGGTDPARGLLCGLLSAGFYASVMLLNKRVRGLSGIEITLFQLVAATVVLLPYAVLTDSISSELPTGVGLAALLTLCVVHTGVACLLFFSSLQTLPGQTAALLSYVDPCSALLFSALLLNERMTLPQWIGAALILGGAAFGELSGTTKKARA